MVNDEKGGLLTDVSQAETILGFLDNNEISK